MMKIQLDSDFSNALVDGEKNARWSQLNDAANFIVKRLKADQFADLMFVCTHNSRRSQFAHVWSEVWARAFRLDGVRCYSGGTEVTACNERTIAALKRVGFDIKSNGGENPDISCKYSDEYPPVICNSSLFTSAGIEDFAAMMCCSDVDSRCPIVQGAAIRIPLHYDDPKSADDTDEEESRYDERCRQIGGDMMLLMSTAANRFAGSDVHN